MRVESPLLVKIAGRLSSTLLWSLFRTLRLQLVTSRANPYACHGDERYLFSVWHDAAVIAAFGGRHTRTVALTSRHRDGSFVASIIDGVGVRAVRGSSGRGGQRAARELIEISKHKDIVITPDGPRGPRRQMSRGIIFLASRTGNAIVPTGFACSRAWDVKGSWTTLTIPKPFAHVALLAGEPISVPPEVSAASLNSFVDLVQQAMDRLQLRAAAMLQNPRENAPHDMSMGDPRAKAA